MLTQSETWLNSSITDLELEIPGYDLYRVDRNTKPGGGVGVYVRQTYKVKVVEEISNISDNGLHQLSINLQVRNLKSIVICTMYRPPDTLLSSFDTYLTPSLITASLQNKPIYQYTRGWKLWHTQTRLQRSHRFVKFLPYLQFIPISLKTNSRNQNYRVIDRRDHNLKPSASY